MFDTICTLPLSADIFTLALHPTQPIFTIGLSTGHVYSYRLPSTSSSNSPSISPPPPLPASTAPISNGTLPDLTSLTSLTNGDLPRRSSLSSYRRTSSASSNGLDTISTLWSTRRHKGSCRTLTYSISGDHCYSAGTDGLIKKFDSVTGKVVDKHALRNNTTSTLDTRGGRDFVGPTVLKAVGEDSLLIGLDDGTLELRDLRISNDSHTTNGTTSKKSKSITGTWAPHSTEHINDLLLLPASDTSTSGIPKSCVSVGGTTLAVTDFRKGVVSVSADQDTELTSLTYIDGLSTSGTSVGAKVLVGQADGVVSLFEKGVWDDIDDRVIVDEYTGSIDTLTEVPLETLDTAKRSVRPYEKIVAAGVEDGRVRFVRIGRNGVLSEWDVKHHDDEGVVGVGFDAEGRMVSVGGEVVKVWTEAGAGLPGTKGAGFEAGGVQGKKRKAGAGNGNDESEEDDGDEDHEEGDHDDVDDDESDAEPQPQQETEKGRRKKRKRNKGKDKSGGRVMNFAF